MSRVFRIGYVEESEAPFTYSCFLNRKRPCKPGISGEIWTEIAKQLNLTLEFHKADLYGGYEPEANGKFEGILGLIQDDIIDATLSFQSLRPVRFQYLNYTEPALTYESGLVIGELFETIPQIQVQVFDWFVVSLLMLSLLLLWIYSRLWHKFRRKAALPPDNLASCLRDES
uniref:Ionotropic glutamate receptor L-glutamate and glycine-binding domain-containing protein n=1 Tax=Plectus sambesii TaxID=2011161 RepID=A0A914WRD2_9BILA